MTGRVERARTRRRFNYERAARQPGDYAIAHRKVYVIGMHTGHVLGYQRAAGLEQPAHQHLVIGRIRHVHAAAQYAYHPPAAIQRALHSSGVYAHGHARYELSARLRKVSAKAPGDARTFRRTLARAYDRNAFKHVQVAIAAHEQQFGRYDYVGQFLQALGIFGVAAADKRHAAHAQPLQQRIYVLFRVEPAHACQLLLAHVPAQHIGRIVEQLLRRGQVANYARILVYRGAHKCV